jgi:hypothetical protein
MTAVQPYKPALGDWVVVIEGTTSGRLLHQAYQVVGVPADTRDLCRLATPVGTYIPPRPWCAQGRDWLAWHWLPGWSGYCTYWGWREVRPATPEEAQAARLDQLVGGGL